MTKFQSYLLGIIVLILGVGLLVAGLCLNEEIMTTTGSGLIGTALGWLGLSKPADRPE
jgi:uncharacterized membrane protein YkgB